ncbi:hypothetical protein [Ferrovibrio sp.]
MTDQIPIRAHEPAGQPAPDRAGIGLRAPHHRRLLEPGPPVGWLESLADN